eukprot:TRINITY_DN19944_c0_g1_i1.p1 TRINITY_DN19944_c0_g1~~TRINITY_DN19944_c0_g1_i1.p1  ORF type:complete len:640 (-),score=131.98 TRINITY_DN19944_c0_g1_i1:41-1960(-)
MANETANLRVIAMCLALAIVSHALFVDASLQSRENDAIPPRPFGLNDPRPPFNHGPEGDLQPNFHGRLRHSHSLHAVLSRTADRVCTLVTKGPSQMHTTALRGNVHINTYPRHVEEHKESSGEEMVEIFAMLPEQISAAMRQQCSIVVPPQEEPDFSVHADIVKKVVDNGPPENRIDVVFMGDGYTAAEEAKFDEDMKRLIDDMFRGTTFRSYLPVFNVWTVFRASQESGIGYYSRPKNTAFGLFRQGTELRGIYCSKPNAARSACTSTGPFACDYPTLIGNDPYYGGLGGEFSISTSSVTSGTKVLRHEFGHSMGYVGEEYDGGNYFGANYSPSLDRLGWPEWLTQEPILQKSSLLSQDYAWYDLAKGPYNIPFRSDGQYKRWFMRFSVSGCPEPDSLVITLDGVRLNWTSSGLLDRSFYEYYVPETFSAGSHVLTFSAGFAPAPGNSIRQLCSVNLIEYKNDDEYNWDNDAIVAYPNYGNQPGFRPNNEFCLMRNMTSEAFCRVCIENLWHQFLTRMSLIDDLQVKCEGSNAQVTLTPVGLAQFRDPSYPPVDGDRYSLSWFRDGQEYTELRDLYTWSMDLTRASGTWTARLTYTTPEVRAKQDLLRFEESIVISDNGICSVKTHGQAFAPRVPLRF